jgi:hypothetical protein
MAMSPHHECERHVYSHKDALLLKLFEMLRRVDINIVFEVLRDGVCALVLVLTFRRIGSRRTCAGFAPDFVHGALEIIDNRGEFLQGRVLGVSVA